MEEYKNQDLDSLLDQFKRDGIDYVNKRIRWLQVSYQIRSAKFLASAMYGLFVAIAIFIVLFFSLIGLALFVAKLLDSTMAGFLVMGLFSLIVVLLMLAFKKQFKSYLLNRSASFLTGIDRDDEILEDNDE